MSSPKDSEEPMCSDVADADSRERGAGESGGGDGGGDAVVAPVVAAEQRPPAKRRLSGAVIEISDTESDDSDVCAVTTYQASADEVKRIRGDYSSSSSSSSGSYSSDSESPWEDDSILLEDRRPLSKVHRAQLNPRAERTEDPYLNPKLKSQEVIDRLKTHWKEQKNLETEEVTLTCEPFRLCLLHNLLKNPDIVNNIVDDMNTLDWERKKMDLYEFHQTVDLANLTWQRSIKGIYELLKNELMPWAAEVTGLELASVSASCSLYGPGDHLLVHDDLLGQRRLAFVLYLAPWRSTLTAPALDAQSAAHNGNGDHIDQCELGGGGGGGAGAVADGGWSAALGGALELVSRDALGQPADVTHRVTPANNTLALFKVGPDSFHQVAEVLSLELPRLSINGWFHGAAEPPAAPPPPPPLVEDPDAPPPPPEPLPFPVTPLHSEIVLLEQWVEAAYMSPVNRGQIQKQMERESEVSLRDFLQPDKLRELVAALADPEVEWERAGPLSARRCERVAARWAAAGGARSHAVRGALRLWGSAAFARLLADCTDLPLARTAALELQRWRPGDYTLLPSREWYAMPRLQAIFYVGVAEAALCGGHTTFLAPEDERPARDAALVTVPARDNALALVYCDAGAAAFTKYVSRLSQRLARRPAPRRAPFYLLTCTYLE